MYLYFDKDTLYFPSHDVILSRCVDPSSVSISLSSGALGLLFAFFPFFDDAAALLPPILTSPSPSSSLLLLLLDVSSSSCTIR